ncbi:MAG: hypothetical protein COB33_011970 [Thiotrichaceae bacterium]|nr:hypothetical protein [Thiotrichaceae bacterium]
MSTISALNSGIAGIQRGVAMAEKSAATIASTTTSGSGNPTDVAEPLVELMMARLQVEASAKVVETISDTIGTLINTTA